MGQARSWPLNENGRLPVVRPTSFVPGRIARATMRADTIRDEDLRLG